MTTTIQMGDVYRAVRDVLNRAGHERISYSLEVEWWNHRHDTQEPTVTIYVAWTDQRGAHYAGPDFATALTLLDADLPNHPGLVVPPPLPAVADVAVEF